MRRLAYLSFALAACSGSAPAAQAPEASPVAEPATVASAPAPSDDLAARRQAFAALVDEHWEYAMRTSPEYATMLGDLRYNDRWRDWSEAAARKEIDDARGFLARFEAIDPAGFPEQEAISHRIKILRLRETVDTARFEDWLMPVDQMGGPHTHMPQMASMLRFQSVKDYEDYLERLDAIPTVLEQVTARMRSGMAKGLMPPRLILERLVTQLDGLAKSKPADMAFAQPVKTFPEAIAAAEQQRLRAAILASIEGKVLPAYASLAAFVRTEYAPKGRTDIGIWALPDGAARYAAEVKSVTTTSLTPDEIHEIGLREVARIEAESLAIGKRLGFKDLKTFQAAVRKNKKLYARSGQQLLDLYKRHTDAMYQELPKLFGRLPKQPMVIEPIAAFRAKDFAAAEYQRGAPDGSRPGTVRVNTHDATRRSLTDVETTVYHEGVPGHHLQIAIGQELPDIPRFRRHSGFTAFVEGWALYSERLGKEVGFFQDPYSEYGHLQAEMMRAIRLVVDTGIHHKKWTRQQVVDFFHAHSTLDEPTVQNETDRYIAWPGQALGYKVGQLTILRLRAKAQEALGAGFDLRAFHDEVLGAGALPLDLLESRIDAWIARAKA